MTRPNGFSPATIAAVVVLAAICVVVTVVWNAPANWLAVDLANRTHGVFLLADARGTVWNGSAVMALGSPDPAFDAAASNPRAPNALALPGRVTWTLEIDRGLALVLHLTHDGVLTKPLAIRYRDGGLAVDPGSAVLPAAILRLTGAPLNTLLPEGRCALQWSDLRFGGPGFPTGSGTLRVGAFALAISPVRPLGDYLLSWASGATGVTWRLSTDHGPLDVQGSGSVVGRRGQVRVVVRIARDASAAVAAQLNPLLDMLGRRNSDEAVIEVGGR
ncbi:MAG: type II secretion system protein N [Burkholderiaceae bacterium]